MSQYRLFFADYSLRPCEIILALREARALCPEAQFLQQENVVLVDSCDIGIREKLRFLSFFSRFEDETGYSTPTFQSMMEKTGGGNRRNIRYSMHSLHEYKGRFYPQLGKSLINSSGLPENGVVLDPFCGCGTVLLESALLGVSAIGLDINPIGWMIAKAKIIGMKMSCKKTEEIRSFLDHLSPQDKSIGNRSDIDATYLSRWFPENNLQQALAINGAIRSAFSPQTQIFLQVILSNLLTNFSYQNPKEQRIRRRLDAPPEGLLEAFRSNAHKHLNRIDLLSKTKLHPRIGKVSAYMEDSRNMRNINDNSIDCVVTSPPYATAMPYIDANRLSLYFFGFVVPNRKISLLESQMIGSREITVNHRRAYEKTITTGNGKLPDDIMNFLEKIHDVNVKFPAGFRRRNMAALLYKYFFSMQETLREIYRVLKPGCMAHFVVGNNFTIAGGSRVEIPTAQFINIIAQNMGFNVTDVTPMTTPRAYSIYAKNAVKEEFISTLTKRAHK